VSEFHGMVHFDPKEIDTYISLGCLVKPTLFLKTNLCDFLKYMDILVCVCQQNSISFTPVSLWINKKELWLNTAIIWANNEK